ncbi:MAG: ABC transporter substrate-binding protein [Ferruginibacter sp.]
MKKIFVFLVTGFLLSLNSLKAQDDTLKIIGTYQVGIFAPLYLDSVFNNHTFRYTKTFPRFTLPGLDFIQGAQIALDSLGSLPHNINASFYDTKSTSETLAAMISAHKLDSLHLIIGSVKDADYLMLAKFALQKNIPFISATYPNDAGIAANPFVVIVNSTLKAHCEAIFSNLLQTHSSDKIFLVRKPGPQEDRIAAYIKQINEPDGKPLLNIQTINAIDNFVSLENKMDTAKTNVIIGGTLDEKFALRLTTAAFAYSKSVDVKLMGMPNWENFAFNKIKTPDFPVYFTTPYYNVKWDAQSKMLKEVYNQKFKGNPSDLSYKGFELVSIFTRLLANYPIDFISHLNDHTKLFTRYNFRPVFLSAKSTTPDYFENKHLYFIKLVNGAASLAW